MKWNLLTVGVMASAMVSTLSQPTRADTFGTIVALNPDSNQISADISYGTPGYPEDTVGNYITAQAETSFTLSRGSLYDGGSAFGKIELQPFSTISVTATVYGAASSGILGTNHYWVGLTGPSFVPVPVHINITGGVTTPVNPRDINSAQVTFDQGLGVGYQRIFVGTGPTFSGSIPETLISGDLYRIGTAVSVGTSIPSSVIDSQSPPYQFFDVQSGYIDPIITIDPDFPDASKFSFVFSPGVGNGPAAAPGPVAGGGLPGVVFTIGGLFAWWRRCQQAA